MAKGGNKQKKVEVLPIGKQATADYVSMHARKIDNGHIVTKTIGTGSGYHTTETYHKELPLEINASTKCTNDIHQNSLKKAINELHRS